MSFVVTRVRARGRKGSSVFPPSSQVGTIIYSGFGTTSKAVELFFCLTCAWLFKKIMGECLLDCIHYLFCVCLLKEGASSCSSPNVRSYVHIQTSHFAVGNRLRLTICVFLLCVAGLFVHVRHTDRRKAGRHSGMFFVHTHPARTCTQEYKNKSGTPFLRDGSECQSRRRHSRPRFGERERSLPMLTYSPFPSIPSNRGYSIPLSLSLCIYLHQLFTVHLLLLHLSSTNGSPSFSSFLLLYGRSRPRPETLFPSISPSPLLLILDPLLAYTATTEVCEKQRPPRVVKLFCIGKVFGVSSAIQYSCRARPSV